MKLRYQSCIAAVTVLSVTVAQADEYRALCNDEVVPFQFQFPADSALWGVAHGGAFLVYYAPIRPRWAG